MKKVYLFVGNMDYLLEKEEILEFFDNFLSEVSKEIDELKKQIMLDIKLLIKEEML